MILVTKELDGAMKVAILPDPDSEITDNIIRESKNFGEANSPVSDKEKGCPSFVKNCFNGKARQR